MTSWFSLAPAPPEELQEEVDQTAAVSLNSSKAGIVGAWAVIMGIVVTHQSLHPEPGFLKILGIFTPLGCPSSA